MLEATLGVINAKSSRQNYTETENPNNREHNSISNSFASIIEEITFAYVRKGVAEKNRWVAFYNWHFYFRWALYSFLCTIWYNNPRTIYSIFLGYSFLQYIYTFYIWIIGGFKRPAGFYIWLSELCIFVRHVVGFALFVDFFGSKGFSASTEDFWGMFGGVGYGIGLICEFILLWEPFFNSDNQIAAPVTAPIKLVSKPIPIPINNDDELFNKVQTHKNLRNEEQQNQRMHTPGRAGN